MAVSIMKRYITTLIALVAVLVSASAQVTTQDGYYTEYGRYHHFAPRD